MFSICRQTHPATGIEHSVSCYFFDNEEACLVTAGANIVKVFRLYPEGDSKEYNAVGQPIPPKMKLECLASYTLWGNVMSMQAVRCPSMGRDLLLLSFREAKLSVVQYDPQTNDLITLSMHYFEEDDMKNGWTTHPHIPWVRVDPEGRCAIMLLYGKKLAVLPFRKDNPTDEGDPLDAKPLADTKKMYVPQPVMRSPVLASYVIVLKDLDEKLDNILDIQFLYGYYEPTLLLLYEPVKTFPGRTAVRSDTCAMAAVSVNISARVHPVIWSISALPFDCLQAVPVQKPLGGCLILAVNSLIYLNQSVPPYGVSLNSIASSTTNFPLRVQEGVCITLDGACVATMGEGKFILSLKAGQLYVLTLISDSVRSVRSFHLDRAAASVLTTCMCVIEEDFLFLGSRLGNSLLLRATERENRMLLSVEKPLEATVDLTEETSAETQQKEDATASKKRRIEEQVVDLTPVDNIDLTAHEELQVYGSDVRTTTKLSGYLLEVCDSLLNICPIGSVSLGEPATSDVGTAALGSVELVASAGAGKNGALSVLRRAASAHTLTAFDLSGCVDMWSVLGESKGERVEDAQHAYLILSQEDSSMVLQTGQEINEVDNSGFMTSSPTVFAGNLGNNKFMVQVTQTHIRLLKNGNQIQSIQLEWTVVYACTADPYLCVLSSCGEALVLALRSSRLVPTRQSLPSRPALVRAALYRDLSGLFTSADLHATQIKGEFTGKKKEKLKKKPKTEGLSSDTVYEINDDDELYGGDATPASMHTIMLEEQGVCRRSSRWWERSLPAAAAAAPYWLLCARDSGNLEIYSLPDMRLSYLVQGATAAPNILSDSLESVSLSDLKENESTTQSDAKQLQELAIYGLGNKGSRVLLMMRFPNELVIYQAYKYPRGNLKMRFSRVAVNFAFGYRDYEPSAEKMSYETSLLKENVRKIRYFDNVAGYNGVFICGATPYFIILTARGELRCHPLPIHQAPALTFAPFNNTNCSQGFMYFDDKDSLRICVLPTHLSYDAPWPVRKVAVRQTPHFLAYHAESRTYCLVASQPTTTTSYYRFNGEDKELHQENKPDRFPYPVTCRYSVSLFSPVSWGAVPGSRVSLPAWEHACALQTVHLHYQGTASGLRGYIALGTNFNYGEDITSRGRIIIYDVIEVVPEPGQPLTKHRLKEVTAREQKGPVTAVTHVLGYLLTAIGQKIYIWELRDSDLIGIAFIDTSIFVHRVIAVKNLILVADVYKSVCLLRYQQKHRTLSLVARDFNNVMVYDIQFMVEGGALGLVSSEAAGNLAVFMYQPQARESYGGQRLVRKADYHVGQPVHAMFRLAARGHTHRHATYYTTLDGGIGYVLPLSEKPYRRLLMLQNVLNNWLCHYAGLNPRGYRTYKSSRRAGGAARGVLDGDLLARYRLLPPLARHEIAKKIGTKVEEILADLYDIDRQTAHF